ncbi:MAG: PglD-related sugar-binding protein [Bacteroidia bacterium]
MANRIVIIGAGGHGKVVLDAILAQGKYEVVGFVDGNVSVGKEVINSYKVIAKQDDLGSLKDKADYFIVAIGNNQIRSKIAAEAKSIFKAVTIIHPSAVIGSQVNIKEGTVVLANSVINASASVGENVIVNARVVVDHDCIIGNNVHLSIGTMVGSNSRIGDYKTTSIGENINSFSVIK